MSKDKISIQLYTLRNLFEADLEGTMSALADIGYRKVEMAGTYGRSAAEFRRILDANHIRATSTHVGIDGIDLDQAIADARTLGNRRVVHPYANFATIAEWEDFAARLEAAGKAFRRAGIPLGYHNHNHEFLPIDGVKPYDVITHGTSRRNVYLEMDLYWVVTGEQDPVRGVLPQRRAGQAVPRQGPQARRRLRRPRRGHDRLPADLPRDATRWRSTSTSSRTTSRSTP